MLKYLKFEFKHLFLAVFILCLVYLSLHMVNNYDLWWMLKTGQYIVRTRMVPHTDPFSYTSSQHPWLNHSWLSSVLIFLVFKRWGLASLYLLKAFVLLIAFLICIEAALRRTDGNLIAASLAGLWMIYMMKTVQLLGLRAYLLSFLMMSLTLLILDEFYRRKNKWNLLLLIPVNLIWANLHGGFVLSFVLQVLFLLSFLIEGYAKIHTNKLKFLKLFFSYSPKNRSDTGKSLDNGMEEPEFNPLPTAVLVLVLSALACLINPYSYKIFSFILGNLGGNIFTRHVTEYSGFDFTGRHLGFAITALILIYAVVKYRRQFQLIDLGLLLVFTLAPFSAGRHGALFVFAILPVAAVFIDIMCKKIYILNYSPIKNKLLLKIIPVLLLISILLFSWYAFNRLNYKKLALEPEFFPRGAAQFIKLNQLPGKMFNPYDWGGYLIWKLYPNYRVFIDSRADSVYSGDVFREYIDVVSGTPRWGEILEKYNVSFVIVKKPTLSHPSVRIAQILRSSSSWLLVYEDLSELVFIKKSPSNRRFIERLEKNHLVYPATPYRLIKQALNLMDRGDLDRARKKLQTVVSWDPDNTYALSNLAYIAVRRNNLQKAVKIARRVLSINPKTPGMNLFMGDVEASLGNVNTARKYYRREIKFNPRTPPAKRAAENLAELKE